MNDLHPNHLADLAFSILVNRKERPFLQLYGYSDFNIEMGEKERYEKAKVPIGQSWTYQSKVEAEEWRKQGGWTGLPIKEKQIAVDIDDEETGQIVHQSLIKADIKHIGIKTPNGFQFIFADTGKVKTQVSKYIMLAGIVCDYRLAGKGQIVMPSENTPGREFIHVNETLDPMPLMFLPVRKFSPKDTLLDIPIYEGSRDDTLFRHACRIREWDNNYRLDLTEDDLLSVLEEINLVFCEPPLRNSEVWAKIRSACRYKTSEHESTKPGKTIRVVSISEFLSLKLPPRENILKPWLPTQGLTMVYGPRGVGKTYFAMGVAVAVASVGQFLKWTCEKPFGVLYIDGEMPAVVDQERFSSIIIGAEKEPIAPLKIITPDLQAFGMPDLSTHEGQEAIEPFLADIKLVIVDNISTLCRQGRENESESWLPVQEWGLRLRSKHISLHFVHHTGKSGLQRGTSRREDVLDTIISLKRPSDYKPDEGARFEVHFDKARNIYGEDVKPFEAKLVTIDGIQQWTVKDLEESLTERVANLLNEGIPQSQIHELLGVSKGTVSKHKKKAQAQGLLKVQHD